MSETKIVNLRKEKCDVRICRTKQNKIPPPPDPGCFGNPFPVETYGRVECLRLYEIYFNRRILHDTAFRDAVMALRGSTLGCFCKPLDCHGDIIKAWLDAQP